MVASHKYVENIKATFERAAEANRNTPGRQGSTIVLTTELAADVLVTGDIHGHRRNFNRVRKIAALDENPHRHLVLQEVCHGGPTYHRNGGCISHTVLEDVAALKCQFPNRVHFLLGNHELAELTDFPIQKNRQLLNLLFRLGLRHMYGAAAEEIREAALRFLWTCPLAVRLPHGVFIAHSLPDSVDHRGFNAAVLTRDLMREDGDEDSEVFRMLWGRDYRRENAAAFCEKVGATVLITGHEPCLEGFLAPNNLQLILDCCGDRGAYVCLPVGENLSHADILQRVHSIEEPRGETRQTS